MLRLRFAQLFIVFSLLLASALVASPVDAAPFGGNFSVGLGGGMGDNNVGPAVISGKYWTRNWEVGAELFYDGDKNNEIDQFVLPWAAYRVDLHSEDRNNLYMGLGPGAMVKGDAFKESLGIMVLVGWDGKNYGTEFKYGYFTPSIYSWVVYYNF